jgi:hypothetical protein
MARNTALLERVMQHILDNPEQHKQDIWVNDCGTAACFAGWACLLSGWLSAQDYLNVVRDEERREVKPAAMDALGLTPWEAERLFDAGNTRDRLALMVKDLVNGDELRAPWDYDEVAS